MAGYDGTNYISTNELLDQGATSFVRGKPFPYGLVYHSMVEDPAGGVIIINGITDLGKFSHIETKIKAKGNICTFRLH